MADVASNPEVLKRKESTDKGEQHAPKDRLNEKPVLVRTKRDSLQNGAGLRQRRARVTFSYEPQHEDELALKVGDELIIDAEDEEGWYQATLRGKNGVCPSNFVEIIADETGEMAAKPEVTPVKEKEAKEKASHTNSLPRAGSLKEAEPKPTVTPVKEAATSETPPADDAKGERSAKKIVGVGFGNIFKDGGVKLKNTSTSNGNEKVIGPTGKNRSGSAANVDSKDAAADAKHTEKAADKEKDKEKDKDKPVTPSVNKENVNSDAGGSSTTEYCKAEFDYKAANGDELSFQQGDVIRVVNKNCEDEGWWMGELNGRTGVFPDNFVALIPHNQVSAPKRPARPIATEKNMTAAAASEKKDDPLTVKKEDTKPDKSVTAPAKLPTPSASSAASSSADKPAKTESVAPPRPEKPSKPVITAKKPVTPVAGKSREDSPLADTPEKPPGHARTTSVGSDVGVKTEPEEPRAPSANSLDHPAVVLRHHPHGHTNGHAENHRATTFGDSVLNRHRDGSFDDVLTGQKLNHMTTSRPRGPQRRPPSMIRPNSEEDGKLTPDGLDVIEEPPLLEPKSSEARRLPVDTASDKEKDREPVLAKKNSFLKDIDTASISRARSPSVKHTSTASAPNLEEEVRHLREEVKNLKESFASQIQEFEALLKTQTARVTALEKELEELRKAAK